MATALKEAEIITKTAGVPSWRRSGNVLVRIFKFPDFAGSMTFVQQVAQHAEAMDHHPDILIQYNKVTLTLSTHSAGGLTELDFALAQKIGA